MISLNEAQKAKLEQLIWDEVPDEFVVFDTETTGLNPKKDRILEIGAVLFRKDDYKVTKEVSTFQCFIKQTSPIPADATKINGITDEMVADGESEYDALDKFFEFVGPRDLYAYNSKFDEDFLNHASTRCGYSKAPIIKDSFDICEYIRETWEIKPNYRLTTVAKQLGINVAGAHRAVGDSVLAMQCFVQVKQQSFATKYIYDIDNEARTKALIAQFVKKD
jgi:DNA polymerase III epsilon subunit family exonuclease